MTSWSRKKLVLFTCLGALSIVSPALAAGDPKEAKKSFKAGSEAYAKGEFKTAAAEFENANKLAPHGAALYNAGLAWEAAEDLVQAAEDYTLALATTQLDAKQQKDAETRLAELEKKLGKVEVTSPVAATKVSIDGKEARVVPFKTFAVAGTHTLKAEFPDGKTKETTINPTAGATATVSLEPEAETPKVEEPPRRLRPGRRLLLRKRATKR